MGSESAMHDDYEPSGEHPRAIILIAAGALGLLGASLGVLWGVFSWQVPSEQPVVPGIFPAPQILRDEAFERDQLDARQRIKLDSYAWIDRDKKVIAIPIQRALDILAKRGAAGYEPLIPPESPGQPAKPPASKPDTSAADQEDKH
jgi:hypothetical protein